MSVHRIDMRMICPFYLEVYGRVIRCAPLNEAKSTDSNFYNLEQRNRYIDNFCASHCWQGCIIAQMLLENDETNSGIATPM